MPKPTWKPDVPMLVNPTTGRPYRDPDYKLCDCCGWRSVLRGVAWCATCLERAREMGGPKEAPGPPVIRQGQKGRLSDDEKRALLDSIHANNERITAEYLGRSGGGS